MLNENYLDTLSPWKSNDTLCVCPLDTNGHRYALCSPKEDLTCVGADQKPGVHVDTGSRDQRSADAADRESIRDRLETLRQKRSIALKERHSVVKVRELFQAY